MADYSQFPFNLFSVKEIADMAVESSKLGDDEFVQACVEELKKRKVHHDHHPQDQDGNSLHR